MKTLLSLLQRSNSWSPAWIRDDTGEVFPAQFRVENGHVIVKMRNDRMVEGYHDGKTSRDQIALWWPAASSSDLIQWEASSRPAPPSL